MPHDLLSIHRKEMHVRRVLEGFSQVLDAVIVIPRKVAHLGVFVGQEVKVVRGARREADHLFTPCTFHSSCQPPCHSAGLMELLRNRTRSWL